MTRIIALSGSPSPHSKTSALSDHVLSRLQAPGIETAHLKLADLDPAALLRAQSDHASLRHATGFIDRADGVIVATPIFKASFSGLLKAFLDILPQFALAGKVVMPLATGGSPAHVLALDYGLRPVLQSMGARHIVQAVFVNSSHIETKNDQFVLAPESDELLDEAILHFGHALRSGVNSPVLLGHPRPDRRAPAAKLPALSN